MFFLLYNDEIYVLQEHTAQYSFGCTVCHHDLCSDERVVLDSPVGRGYDFSPGGSGSEYIILLSKVDTRFTYYIDFRLLGTILTYLILRNSELEHWEVLVL